MKDKKKNWLYRLGYNVGGFIFICGVLFGSGFDTLVFAFALYQKIPLNAFDIFIESMMLILAFALSWQIGKRYNYWLDEDQIKKELINEVSKEMTIDSKNSFKKELKHDR